MELSTNDCCILNGGSGSWAFEPLAQQLSRALGVAVSEEPRRFNYLLHLESMSNDFAERLFIPWPAIRLASDKRLMAAAFERGSVPTPRTVLIDNFDDVTRFIAANPQAEWCLKYPTSCGAIGHRLISATSSQPPKWPRPFVVQEFIRQVSPEVYRLYGAGGELFGWVARRFPAGTRPSPWVAHARGACYEFAGEAPRPAIDAAHAALRSCDLDESFGCVDLLPRPSGEWVVLEVGTDGMYNHVDRALGILGLEAELLRRIADSFWKRAYERRPADGRTGGLLPSIPQSSSAP